MRIRNWTVYYYRHLEQAVELYHGEPPGPFSVENLAETHVELLQVSGESLSSIYHAMQDVVWSPYGEAKPLLQALGLTHTSLSIGDVVRDDRGVYWLCQPYGWHKMNQEESNG